MKKGFNNVFVERLKHLLVHTEGEFVVESYCEIVQLEDTGRFYDHPCDDLIGQTVSAA